MYHYAGNNPIKYTDPDGNSLFAAAIVGGLISAAVDYGFQVAGNYMSGKTGTDAWTDVNVGQIAGSFVSGALTTVGLSGVSKAAFCGANFVVKKATQVVGSAVVSSAASIPGTVTSNLVNNIIDSDSNAGIFDGTLENMKSSAIAGAFSGAITPVPKISPWAPDYIKNAPQYTQKNGWYVRKGSLPGTPQAAIIQTGKDLINETASQGFSKGVDAAENAKRQNELKQKRIDYYQSLYGNKD